MSTPAVGLRGVLAKTAETNEVLLKGIYFWRYPLIIGNMITRSIRHTFRTECPEPMQITWDTNSYLSGAAQSCGAR